MPREGGELRSLERASEACRVKGKETGRGADQAGQHTLTRREQTKTGVRGEVRGGEPAETSGERPERLNRSRSRLSRTSQGKCRRTGQCSTAQRGGSIVKTKRGGEN